MSDEYGPPTLEDDMWFHEHVRAAGYPKVKRDPAQLEGQELLPLFERRIITTPLDMSQAEYDVRPHSWTSRELAGALALLCVDCLQHGPIDDRVWKDRKDREGCPFDVEDAMDFYCPLCDNHVRIVFDYGATDTRECDFEVEAFCCTRHPRPVRMTTDPPAVSNT